jgi:protein-tyrosine phosphatase
MIYPIALIKHYQIAISTKPQGFAQLETEIHSFRLQRIDMIINLLEDWEIEQFGLIEEENLCQKHDIKFDRLPITDNSIPGFQRFANKIEQVYAELPNIKNLVVHCNHGLGRSGLFVAGLLLHSGMQLDRALEIIEQKRGFRCPTSPAQMRFIKSYNLFLNDNQEYRID